MIVKLEIAELINPLDIRQVSLEYLLTEDKAESHIDPYGIQIIKTTIKNQFEETESAKVPNIFYSKEKAENVLRVLAENTVTPTSLNDVIQDLMF